MKEQKSVIRDSNMELLRIIAMIGILVLHADFFALGFPKMGDCSSSPLFTIFRFFIESIFIISVNLFVLLSGWYGIKPRKRSFLNLCFQIFFFNILFFCIFSFITPHDALCWDGISSIFMIDSRFWFVKSYILLYFLSPVLNSFAPNTTKNRFFFILVGFFLFQSFYGWFFKSVRWFYDGYSTISFIGLYLLAQYLRHFVTCSCNHIILLLLFLFFVIFNTATAFIFAASDKDYYSNLLFCYNSPFVILASVVVFLLFQNFSLRSNLINYIAISSFAVFLFHANHFFLDRVYVPIIRYWFTNDLVVVFLLKVFIFIVIVFGASIAIDKIRIYVYSFLEKTI